MNAYDVVIVGGGPSGLSAALLLARARKTVLLYDAGSARNSAAEGVHNFVTRDGVAPQAFRRAARDEIAKYGGVTFLDQRVSDVVREGAELQVSSEDGSRVRARRVILAVGVIDEVPEISGLREQWGRSAFQCPYCHGWEARDQSWGILADDDLMAEHALLSFGWTDRVTVFANGHAIASELRTRLENAGAKIAEARVARVVSTEDRARIEYLELADGTKHSCAALMLRPKQHPTALVERMKLVLDDGGFVKVDDMMESSMRGVYVAGDAQTFRQAAVLAAAAGTAAGASANFSLTLERATGVLRSTR